MDLEDKIYTVLDKGDSIYTRFKKLITGCTSFTPHSHTDSNPDRPKLIRVVICVRIHLNQVDSNQPALIPTPLESRFKASWIICKKFQNIKE